MRYVALTRRRYLLLYSRDQPQMEIIIIIIILFALLLPVVISLVRNKISCLLKGKILFVIAHPDDECMFFAPAILRASENNPTYVLCLCNG